MRHLLITALLSCFLFSLKVIGQNRKLDSITNLIATHEMIDTMMINLRNDYIHQKIFNDPTDSTLVDYAKETLKMAEELEFVKGQVMAIQRIGVVIHYLQGKPLEAIDYYQKALEILDTQPKLKKYIPGSLINLANIYNGQGDHEKSLALFKRIYREFENNDVTSQRIGSIYVDLGNIDSAIHYFELAIIDASKIQNYNALAYSHSVLAAQIVDRGQLKDAVNHIEQSLSLLEEHSLGFLSTNIYSNAAKVYQKNGDFDKAEMFSIKALEAEGPMNFFSKRNLNGTLYEVYKERGDYKSSLEALENYIQFNDSIANDNQKLELAKKEIEFEAKQRELQIQLELEKQNSIRNIIVIGGLFILITGIIGFLLYNQRRKVQFVESQLTALRSQLNPHFIFNALNAIDNYMIESGVEKTSNYLAQFARLMRKILDSSNRNWVSLEEELDLMKLYLEIEHLRMQDRISYSIELGPDIEAEYVQVPSLLLQPFIENSIEHAISKRPEGGIVKISITKENSELVCIVEDNGPGISTKPDPNSKGMVIGKSRIDYVQHVTKGKSRFEIKNLEPGVRVTVRIPYKTEF